MSSKFVIISLVLLLITASCQHEPNSNPTQMDFNENSEIKAILENTKRGMIEYIEPGETEYTESEVKECMKIMDDFLSEMTNSQSKEDGTKSVKKAVLKLNELNEDCGHELIETDQREQLAEIIILAGHLKGYNGRDEDTTGEWRDW